MHDMQSLMTNLVKSTLKVHIEFPTNENDWSHTKILHNKFKCRFQVVTQWLYTPDLHSIFQLTLKICNIGRHVTCFEYEVLFYAVSFCFRTCFCRQALQHIIRNNYITEFCNEPECWLAGILRPLRINIADKLLCQTEYAVGDSICYIDSEHIFVLEI